MSLWSSSLRLWGGKRVTGISESALRFNKRWKGKFPAKTQFVKANPGDQSLLIIETKICFQEKNFPATIDVGESVLTTDPENSFVRGLVAEAQFQNGEFKKAGELFSGVLNVDPDNVGFVIRRKDCYEGDNNIPEAIQFIGNITDKNPKDYFLKMELARLYERQSEDFSASAIYNELRKIPNPFQTDAQVKFEFLKHEGAGKKAAEALRKSSEPNLTVGNPASSTSTVAANADPIKVSGSNDRNSQNQSNSNSSSGKNKVPAKIDPSKTGFIKSVAESKELFKKLSTLYE